MHSRTLDDQEMKRDDKPPPEQDRPLEAEARPGMEEQMRPLLTAVLTATLAGACSSASTPAAAPTAPRGAGHGAQPHDHGPVRSHQGHGLSGPEGAFVDADAWTQVFDDPVRDVWQRPDDVLRALELEPAMSVADVGAGTGYFAVRLARAVPEGEVIATDLEPDMLRFLSERARREQLPNLRTVLATPTTSGLAPSSVDRILIVHVWHHLADHGEYARGLAAALRPGGRLLVVDFSPTAQRGPPASLRVAPETVLAALEGAGLSASVSPIALPDQYIVEGRSARRVGGPQLLTPFTPAGSRRD
jgi:SAM-dependent methyltransferase